MNVNMGFGLNLDATGKTWLYVANLLERGVRVLNVSRYSSLLG